MSRPIDRGGRAPFVLDFLLRSGLFLGLAFGLLFAHGVQAQDALPPPDLPPLPEVDGALGEATDGLTVRYVGVSLANALLGGLATGASLQAERRNLPAPSHAATLGVATGSASMALGVLGVVRGGDERRVGVANLALGATTAWIGWRSGTRPDPPGREIELRPWVEVEPATRGVKAAEVRPGVRFEITF